MSNNKNNDNSFCLFKLIYRPKLFFCQNMTYNLVPM